jgi:hypothetical protein
MKTQNLDLLLLQYNQSQKELLINEWISVVDILFCRYADSFIEELPQEECNKVYIISNNAKGEQSKYRNYLIFYLNGWRYLLPKNGFVFFVESYSSYFIFRDGVWKKHLDSLKKIKHIDGELILDVSKGANFEINVDSDINIKMIGIRDCCSRIEIRVLSNKPIKIEWCDYVVFSEGVVKNSLDTKGGVVFFGYCVDKHNRFIVDKISSYVL